MAFPQMVSDIGLNTSSTGFLYQLYNGASAVGSPIPGNGAALDFGLQTAPGVYTIVATNTVDHSTFTISSITIAVTTDAITGPSSVCLGASITLSNATGGGTWSSSNPAIANISASGVVAGIAAGTTTITYKMPSGVTASLVVTVNPLPTVNAGPDQTVCASSPNVALAGSVGGSATSGTWSGGTGTFVPNNSTLTATYLPSASEIASGQVALTLTSIVPTGNSCAPATSSMTIHISPAATANAGAPQSVCAGGTITLAGIIGGSAISGTWSAASGTFSNVNSLTSTYTPSIASGTVTLTLTAHPLASSPCGAVTGTVVITVYAPATANAGSPQTLCANATTVILSGSIGGGAISSMWSTSGSGSFVPNATTLKAIYVPSAADKASGHVTLTLTTNAPAGPCGAAIGKTDIYFTAVPTANAGSPQSVCAGGTITLAGVIGGSAASGTWSAASGTFSNVNSLTSTYTPSIPNGTVTLTLTAHPPAGSTCSAVTSTVIITVNIPATANAGPNQTVSASSPNVTLAGSVGGGASSGTWSGGAGVFIPNTAMLNATYKPTPAEIAAGSVTLTLTTNDPVGPCGPASSTMTITIVAG